MVLDITISELMQHAVGRLTLEWGDPQTVCQSIEYDSRKVKPGSLFVAVQGLVVDGHTYLENAIAAGAVVLVVNVSRVEDYTDYKGNGIALLSVTDTREALSLISAIFYQYTSKKIPVIGITGTNGKTTTTFLLEAICTQAGYTPGVLGTVNYRWKEKEIAAPNTTPESKDLHELMYRMYRDGVDVIFMEVSSHGLDLGRVNHIDFRGAVFTNLTRDHLDYHKTFEEYYKAKKILFTLLHTSSHDDCFAVINSDDAYGRQLLKECAGFSYKAFGFAVEEATYAAYLPVKHSIHNSINGVAYSLTLPRKNTRLEVSLQLAGNFNIYNSLAAIAVADQLGIAPDIISQALAHFATVPGRFEKIVSPRGFYVIVDYAHTNDALQKVLQTACDLKTARIITVFGCGGDRDKTKRPLMGQIAVSYSDVVIITSDNPRTEDPGSIINDILAGITESKTQYLVEPDREKAIAYAVGVAAKGDIVIIAGKGHETYQILGTKRIHFDDKEIALKYIAEGNASESKH